MPLVRSSALFVTTTLVVTLSACGGEALTTSGGSDAGTDAQSYRDAATDDADGGPQVDASDLDPCPSAVLPGAPRAMLANCSTRDGRSRVVGPKAPHVTFTTPVIMDSSGQSSFMGMAADASGNVFLVVGDDDEDFGSFVRVDASGAATWTTSFAPLSTAYGAPLLTASRTVEFVGADLAAKTVAFDQFDATSGGLTQVSLPSGLAGASADPAIGSDGSFYLSHPVSTGSFDTAVSRVAPNGTVTWTSKGLSTFLSLGSGLRFDLLAPSTLALGTSDLVLVAIVVDGMDSPAESFVVALDPASGGKRWVTKLGGAILGGPSVAKDGSIRVLLGPGFGSSGGPPPTDLVILETSGATKQQVTVGSVGTAEIFALGGDGTSFVGTGAPNVGGFDTLVAVDPKGHMTFSIPKPGLMTATLDGHGTLLVVTTGGAEGVDSASGKTLWTLPSPHAGARLVDATFTSAGGIVGALDDGAVFGASD